MKRFFTLILFFFSFVMICCSQNSGFISQNNEEFAKTIHKKGVQLVDVRTPQEYAAGHIPGAINIDVRGTDFDTNVAKLKKTKPVAVYCKGGKRSKMAANKLVGKGFMVFELDKGFDNWNGEKTTGN